LRLLVVPMQDAADWPAHYRAFLEEQFDSLDEFLQDEGRHDELRD
jgi:hypothetical protein